MPATLAVLLHNVVVAGTEQAYIDASMELHEWLETHIEKCAVEGCDTARLPGWYLCIEHKDEAWPQLKGRR